MKNLSKLLIFLVSGILSGGVLAETKGISAGKIYTGNTANTQAQKEGPAICKKEGGIFTGHWNHARDSTGKNVAWLLCKFCDPTEKSEAICDYIKLYKPPGLKAGMIDFGPTEKDTKKSDIAATKYDYTKFRSEGKKVTGTRVERKTIWSVVY